MMTSASNPWWKISDKLVFEKLKGPFGTSNEKRSNLSVQWSDSVGNLPTIDTKVSHKLTRNGLISVVCNVKRFRCSGSFLFAFVFSQCCELVAKCSMTKCILSSLLSSFKLNSLVDFNFFLFKTRSLIASSVSAPPHALRTDA